MFFFVLFGILSIVVRRQSVGLVHAALNLNGTQPDQI
jgi:hypothetical protein